MKNKITANNPRALKHLIKKEIERYGNECDLNHIDVSKVTNMESLFEYSKFNGDISQWDVSNVTKMEKMFSESEFNGDISNWDVSNVKDMDRMFSKSKFIGIIDDWKPNNLIIAHPIKLFGTLLPPVTVPYWAYYKDSESRVMAINAYHLQKALSGELTDNTTLQKKVKL